MVDKTYRAEDARVVFRDGRETGTKEEIEVFFRDMTLDIAENIDVVPVKKRGRVDHYRRGDTDPVNIDLSWRYASTNLYQDVAQFQTGIPTSTKITDLCESPNDYTDPWWTKIGLVSPIVNNGIAPDAMSVAQELEVQSVVADPCIECEVSAILHVAEIVYVDWWAKLPSGSGQRWAEFEITYHGDGYPTPVTAGHLDYDIADYWQKYTFEVANPSEYSAEETITLRLGAGSIVGDKIDLWGVHIRRLDTITKTWDMYVDFYKKAVKERSIIVEHVQYQGVDFNEGEDGTTWTVHFTSTSTEPYEVIY